MNARVGIGSVQFGLPYGISNTAGQTTEDEVHQILHYASQQGIRLIDTAPAYGNAELVLGRHSLSDFKVVSKFLAGRDVLEQLNSTLHHLRVSTLYGYLAHQPGELLTDAAPWSKLLKMRDQGKIQKLGVSLYYPDELARLHEKGIKPDIVQVPYNYFDRRFEPLFKSLKSDGVEIHIRSAFLQGLFFMNPTQLPDYFNAIKPILAQLQQDITSLPARLLNFVLANSHVDYVILGVENLAQLQTNLLAIKSGHTFFEHDWEIAEEILIPAKWPKK